MAPVTISADGAGQPLQAIMADSASAGRDELVDALALLALTMIGIVGFRPAYGGHAYLAAGAAGIVIGLLLSYAGLRARLPLLAVVTASALAFLLLGGIVSQTGTVTLPTLQEIANAAISGWQKLLTTARPVGRTAGLLVLPYLLGLFSGVTGHALARRTRTVVLPATAPAVVVGLSILFGTPQPVDAAVQGAGFAAVALAWAAVRQARGGGSRTTIGRQRPWQRFGAGAVVLAVAAAGAVYLGPHLPGATAHKRVVLTAVPPVDTSQYPSPLAAFRDYTKVAPAAVNVYGKELLSATGLAKGALVRIAAMDTYDGLSWGVANTVPAGAGSAADAGAGAASTFGGFQRVGALLPDAPAGRPDTATITVEPSYQQPWLPDLGTTTGLSGFGFSGSAGCPEPNLTGSAVAANLRYYVAAGTGVILGGVPCALTYTVSYLPMPAPSLTTLARSAPGGAVDQSIAIPSAVKGFADAHSQAADGPMARVVALANYLRVNGTYSDGGNGLTEDVAGHSEGRLTTFLDSSTKQIVGDDEQYAATMALLADYVGVPAMVSMDAKVGAGGVIKGSDVQADVELSTSQGWVTLPASDFTSRQAPTLQQQLVTPPQTPVKVVPPRHDQAAPVAAANESSSVARGSDNQASSGGGFAIPAIVLTIATDAGIPVVALAALGGALVAAKELRRRRRRSAGLPATRVDGAWRELIDLSRDLGIAPSAAGAPVAAGAVGAPSAASAASAASQRATAATIAPVRGALTRREFAAGVESRGLSSARAVADAADAATFGPADPDGAAAKHVWDLVAAVRRGAVAPLPRWRRVWVAVNPASLL